MKNVRLLCLLLLAGSTIHAQQTTAPAKDRASTAADTRENAGRVLSLDTMVVAASRVQESLLQTPITIEKMDTNLVRETPSLSFYDGLANLKGVEMVTSGLTFNQINARGFNSTGNSRFLQLVDGVDNQTPGLSFAVGNLFGVSDIDAESAELIPGAASALYGPVAFNGVLSINTKDPFKYPGLSVQTKIGVNHIGESLTNPKSLYDVSLRYAQVVNDRLAFKFNLGYFTGTDWYANNYTDVDSGTPAAQRGPNNPARNGLNLYGDDDARTITGVGRVSRTGYEERFLLDYDAKSLKANAAVHYKVNKDVTAIYQYNFGEGTAAYTGSNRFSINNFTLQQHRAELRGSNFFIRAYATIEDSHDSYNAKGLGGLINKTWVRDIATNQVVAESQADNMWYTRYTNAYLGLVPGVEAASHPAARGFADQGRYLPGTPEFEAQKSRLIGIQGGLSGAGILSQSKLYHVEGQYDFTGIIPVVDVVAGGNFRRFNMFTNGTLFDDKGGHIIIDEYGAFVQASKKVTDRLKLSSSLRYDKNENFEGRLTPRASAVYTLAPNHALRLSYQTGFRNPTPGDQYIKLNAGPITILGGVPNNSTGMNVYENTFTSASLGPFFGAFGAAVAQGTPPPVAVNQVKDLLVKSNVAYIKPERVESWEVGYRGEFSGKFVVDASYYLNRYNDFLLNTVVMQPQSPVLGADGKINPQAAFDLLNGNSHLFQLYTNASDQVQSQGLSAGVTYLLPRGYSLGANATWSEFDLQGANPNNIPAFNTPKWRSAVTFGNPAVTRNLGFNVAWRWQTAFDWTSTFNQLRPGRINTYSTIDAQVSYRLREWKSVLKVGGTDLLNNRIYQAYGSPSVGAVYYVSVTFDELFDK